MQSLRLIETTLSPNGQPELEVDELRKTSR